MLTHDHEWDDALAALSSPLDHTPAGWTRRKFLMAAAAAGGTAAAASLIPDAWRQAWAAPPIGARDGILILIGMYGGNDGMNTVIPTANSEYYAKRGAVAIQPATALPVAAGVGLNPGLTFMQTEFQAGRVAIVQGVGYPQYNRSHFESMDIWMRGMADRQSTAATGWIGRYLDGIGPSSELLQGVSFGSSIPLLVKGAKRNATAMPADSGFFGSSTNADNRAAFGAMRAMATSAPATGPWGVEIADAQVDLLDLADTTAPFFTPQLTGSGTTRQLTLAARMINANIGMRVFNVTLGGFDTHTNQQPGHQARLAELDTALRTFWATVSPAFANRVTIMTFSEFGRELRGNASNGTDHGAPSCAFIMGPRVAGGLHGALPDLTQVDRSGQLAFNVDFRSIYASVLETWLGADADAVLGGRFDRLAAFVGPPTDAAYVPGAGGTGGTGGTGGGTLPGGVAGGPPSAPGSYIALNPFRIVDTRIGQAGEQLGSQVSLNAKIAGVGDVPATGATAVMLNVTVDAPTSAGFITVWPGGEGRPLSSNVNFTAGQTVPNLVLCKLGMDGTVSFYNHTGLTQLVVDVVGYFSTGPAGAGLTASQLVALPPARVIDTRSAAAPLVAGKMLELPLAGVAGVPATGADAVVMNVTVTEPTAAGFLTVWPAGQPKPLASSLNFIKGQTVPNLVIAKLGAGKVDIAINTGSTHVVADVVGYFAAGSGSGKGIALSPRRLLDTRTTNEALSYTKVASLVVTGGDVPANASAVMLNVTVTEPTAAGFVTVWPSGSDRPLASSLNFVRNQTVPNLVLAKIGTGGSVQLYTHAPSAHLVVDLVGYFAG